MKSQKILLFSVILTVLASILFLGGSVYAATGCFPDTNGHWAETYICWLQANGISGGYPDGTFKPANNVTRAELAVFLKKTHDLAKTGEIQVVMGPDEWVLNRTSDLPLTLNRYYTDVQVTTPSTGTGFLIGAPDLPVSMYGQALALTGIEFCYSASSTAYLTQFDLYVDTQTSGVSTTYVNLATDPTDRTDSACRLYTFSPVTLSGEKIVSVKIHATWTNASSAFYLGRATFVLQPTTAVIPPLAVPALETPFETPASRDEIP
jgi:hypothetical protein